MKILSPMIQKRVYFLCDGFDVGIRELQKRDIKCSHIHLILERISGGILAPINHSMGGWELYDPEQPPTDSNPSPDSSTPVDCPGQCYSHQVIYHSVIIDSLYAAGLHFLSVCSVKRRGLIQWNAISHDLVTARCLLASLPSYHPSHRLPGILYLPPLDKASKIFIDALSWQEKIRIANYPSISFYITIIIVIYLFTYLSLTFNPENKTSSFHQTSTFFTIQRIVSDRF